MVRFLNIYYPIRTLVLIACEATLVSGAFLASAILVLQSDAYLGLIYEDGLTKIGVITAATLFLSYYFDLYQPQRISERWETYFRLFLVLSVLSFILAVVVLTFPRTAMGHNVLAFGIVILTALLVLWRGLNEWLFNQPFFRERVFVLGLGNRARTVVDLLRKRRDVCMDVVDWFDDLGASGQPLGTFADRLSTSARFSRLDRVIVAMEDRRDSLPTRELLDLRLGGVVVEESGTLLERITGAVPLDGITPSSFIFSHGFSVSTAHRIIRRLLSFMTAGIALSICLPLLPFIMLAVRLSSPGPVFFKQVRVGFRGRAFTLLKFRTMRQNAEAGGAVWASKGDPRVTRVGRIMRKTRLDEIPQLWNVLRGDMAFVGPRPERPEFVSWLSAEIPYYDLRHMVSPGITGWAQVRYQYGASLEETRRKLEYDLYYLKHLSLGLDLLIMFETIKTIVLGRGAQ
jgi:sugar transferase (PEP-CTERM system associated)